MTFVDGPEGLGRWVPGLALLRRHRGAALRRDVVAGVVLAALLVPQGMAYAELAGRAAGHRALRDARAAARVLPARARRGSSSSAPTRRSHRSSPRRSSRSPRPATRRRGSRSPALLAILVGAIMFAGGLARFGFVTELLSMPVRLGYLMGIAVTVIVAQLPKLFGFSVDAESFIPALRDFVAGLDETNATALAIGVGSLAADPRPAAGRAEGSPASSSRSSARRRSSPRSDSPIEVPVVGDVPAGLPALRRARRLARGPQDAAPRGGRDRVRRVHRHERPVAQLRGPAAARRSTRTRSSRSSASRTSRPGSSRASRSPPAARAPRSPRTSAPAASSPGSPAPASSRCS